MKKDIRSITKKDIRSIQEAERAKCVRQCRAVLSRYDGMGFRHNAERAQGAREVLERLQGHIEAVPDYMITQALGLTPVYDA